MQISELKNSVQSETGVIPSQPPAGWSSSDLLFSGCQRATQKEILDGIPPREVTDRLVAEYFGSSTLPRMFNANK